MELKLILIRCPAVPSKISSPAHPFPATVTVPVLPIDILASALLAKTCPAGATKKSPLLTVEPVGVVTVSRPAVAACGTVTDSELAVAEVTAAYPRLIFTLLFAATVEKFPPLIVRVPPPLVSTVGVKLVMNGADAAVPTVNEFELVVEPRGLVTLIVPFVAPDGTVVTIWVVVDDTTVARVPLNFTVF